MKLNRVNRSNLSINRFEITVVQKAEKSPTISINFRMSGAFMMLPAVNTNERMMLKKACVVGG
ncbi:hypothetical protein [Brochothrix thermosphacta]|uniref:hypothetical protein n=1 Tax=Brochothrix thermosphacta TaxID=2756 RepID=UPI00265D2B47|nr:hypothetical protein [Brochothrix thermosphacta]WKK68744.1 hypothetical protein Q0G00_10750 [Brochothrix thermosphacta]